MQVWDIRRAIQTIRAQENDALRKAPLWINGEREMGANMLYASLFEPNIKRNRPAQVAQKSSRRCTT